MSGSDLYDKVLMQSVPIQFYWEHNFFIQKLYFQGLTFLSPKMSNNWQNDMLVLSVSDHILMVVNLICSSYFLSSSIKLFSIYGYVKSCFSLLRWDIIAERLGFMLVFGDLVFIPFTFSIQACIHNQFLLPHTNLSLFIYEL